MKKTDETNAKPEKNKVRRYGIWLILASLLTITLTSYADPIPRNRTALSYAIYEGDRVYTLRIPVKLHYMNPRDTYRVECKTYDASHHESSLSGFKLDQLIPLTGEVNSIEEIALRKEKYKSLIPLPVSWECWLLVSGTMLPGLAHTAKPGETFTPHVTGSFESR
jgi:hypothetical protein